MRRIDLLVIACLIIATSANPILGQEKDFNAKDLMWPFVQGAIRGAKDVQRLTAKANVVSELSDICKGAVVLGPMGNQIIEQALVLDTKKGLVIVTGCSHPGIVAIAKRAKEELHRDIHMILGGTHLLRHSEEELQNVIEELKKLGVQKVAATHCSGDRAISMLQDAFGDGFVKMGVGRVIDIDAE